MSDYLIVGGGVIGLLLARELAVAGAEVTVVEQGRCWGEASWAGGGIVSPLYPWRYPDPVTALADWAQQFYPQLAQELHEETGINPEWVRTGLLMLDPGDEAQALDWARRFDRPVHLVDRPFIRQQEANLADRFERGLWMPAIANIRNPRLGKALVKSLRQRRNVQLREHCELQEVRFASGRVAGLRLQAGSQEEHLSAGKYVLATGAWTGRLLAAAGAQLPVGPVKGQMLLYNPGQGLIRSIVLSAGRYLIPRQDGHILVGSTLEHCDFDKTRTAAAMESLRESAIGMLPALARHEPVGHWAGLRPSSPDGIPFIGQLPGCENLYVNAGHFRNGLVLAPASSRLLADILLARPPILDPLPYQPPFVASQAAIPDRAS